jgi:carboxypeptidase family protein
MARVSVVLVALVLVATSASLQPASPRPGISPQPARDRATPATGTSRIRGRVVTADGGQPLRRAQVRVVAPEMREARVATTDAEGRYEITELPAGRYQLSASKDSFVTISYGQTRPFQPGRPLEVGENQAIERIDFQLPRGGVITGTVLDEYGEPVTGAFVSPMRMQYIFGERRPGPAGTGAQTNDIGEFRIFGLSPGRYYVSASMRAGGAPNEISSDRAGYAPTFYPGTADVAEAQLVTVGLGEMVTNINVLLTPVRVARISGTVVDAEGQPARGGMLTVINRTNGAGFFATANVIRPDGAFTVWGLAPGTYLLRAELNMNAVVLSNAGPAAATAEVTLAGGDVSGIVVAPAKGVTIRGRVLLPPGGEALKPAMISVSTGAARPAPFPAFSRPVTLNDDYTFELESPPGQMMIRAAPVMPSSNWMLKSVRIRGTDVTDTGVELRPGQDVNDVEIVLTNTPPEVNGVVANAKGEPVHDYTALLFTQDSDRWNALTRYTAMARPDQNGRFKVRSLPPGQYYAVAFDYMDPNERSDPEFLERATSAAVRFSLGEGETRSLNLKLTALR